jgi:hypothetical protein
VTERTFTAADLPLDGWQTYRPRAEVRACRVEGPFTVVDFAGLRTACPDGYLILDGAGQPRAVPVAAFTATYELCAPNPGTVDEAAQWLAERSGSARYGPDGLGWRALLDSEPNVEHAAEAALQRGGPPDVVDRARRQLVQWVRERR